MPYATLSDVQALVGDVVKARAFSSSTRPTENEVDAWIEQIQSEIQLRLYSYGFISRTEEVQTTDLSYGWIKRLASVGASARVLQSLPAQAILSPDHEDTAQNRAVNFDREYHRGLTKIQNREILVTDRSASFQRLKSGSAEKCDRPFFRRHQFDHPELDGYGYLNSYGVFEYYPGLACSCCPSDSDDDDSTPTIAVPETPVDPIIPISPPVGPLTILLGISDDDVPEASELTITTIVGVGTYPAHAGEKYLLIGRPTSEGDISSVAFDDSPAIPQFGAYQKYANQILVGVVNYSAWITNRAVETPLDVVVTVR